MDVDSFRLLLALALISLSAFFSGSETALFSLSQTALAELERKGGRSAQKIKHLLAHPRHTLVSILTGNELVNVAFSAIMAGITWHMGLGRTNSIIMTTLLVLLLGEITPKSVALTFPVGYSKLVAPPITIWYRIITPVRVVLQGIANFLSGLWTSETEKDEHTPDEEALLHLIEEGTKEGVIEEIESDLIKRVLDLDDVLVKEIMTPREKIFSLPEHAGFSQILHKLKSNRFSRIPVKNKAGDFIGIFYSREVLAYLKEPKAFPGIRKLMRPPYYVPLKKRAYDLLRDFRLKKKHMALVANEYGEVVGLVTLDDILESLFRFDDQPKGTKATT